MAGHISIRKIKYEQYPAITHEFDVQHVKEVLEKTIAASNKKNCLELAEQSEDMKNYLWWSSATCDRNSDVVIQKLNIL